MVNVDAYEFNDQTTVRDDGHDQGYLIGHNGDTVRSSGCPIMRDFRQTIEQHTKDALYNNWGSAHPSGINMMFADGSVRSISYDINPDVHRGMGTRAGDEIGTEN
jgi:prepilin-type processing-associated H-X9-DG protein